MAMSLPVFGKCLRCFTSSDSQAVLSKCRLLSSSASENLKLNKNEIQPSDMEVEYPPIKPKFPPGRWGEMDHTYAWLWQKSKEELLNIPEVNGRLEHLNSSQMTCIYAIPYFDHPDYLTFAKFASKTQIMPWTTQKPTVYSGVESEVQKMDLKILKQSLIDQIIMETDMIVRGDYLNKQKWLPKLVLRCVADTLITHLSEKCEYLRTCLYDEDVFVRTLWDRHGIERQRRVRQGVDDHYTLKPVQDQRIISSCQFDGMLRCDLPLPQLVERDSGLSVESEEPVLDHKYFTCGVVKHKSTKLNNLVAGHMLGDPCEYGLVGFVSNYQRGENLDKQFGVTTATNCRLGRGLLMTFSWLAAQAHNQGFSGLVDLTYPMTSQTVMSDGRMFSFLAYQLNTLELWKSNEANPLVNLCWHTQEMPLFDCIENGEVKGFNDDVLKMLVTMFMLRPACRGYDMKPTIIDKDTELRLKKDFIPLKEEIVEEPEAKEEYII